MVLPDFLGFLLPAIGLLSNIDRVIEVAEGVALVGTAAGLMNPKVAGKIAKVTEQVDTAVDEVMDTAEVSVGIKVVEALEDGKFQPSEIGELAMSALQLEKRNPPKKSLRQLRREKLDR